MCNSHRQRTEKHMVWKRCTANRASRNSQCYGGDKPYGYWQAQQMTWLLFPLNSTYIKLMKDISKKHRNRLKWKGKINKTKIKKRKKQWKWYIRQICNTNQKKIVVAFVYQIKIVLRAKTLLRVKRWLYNIYTSPERFKTLNSSV